MSPIVYVPQEPHECEPPRQGETVDSLDGEYPEGTLWECEKCAQLWALRYELWMGKTYTFFGRGKPYGYYEVNWRQVND